MTNREDMASFLEIVNTWWLVANSKQKYHPNADINRDGKINFFRSLANWFQEWQECPSFTLSPQASSALIATLRAQSMLVDDLLSEGYEYVMVGRLQSDPLERRFSQYRQMSGGRFLVGLREVIVSERILACRSLIIEDIDFWKEDLRPDLLRDLDSHSIEIQKMMTVAKFQLILLGILAENWRSDQNTLSAGVNYLQLKMTFSTVTI